MKNTRRTLLSIEASCVGIWLVTLQGDQCTMSPKERMKWDDDEGESEIRLRETGEEGRDLKPVRVGVALVATELQTIRRSAKAHGQNEAALTV